MAVERRRTSHRVSQYTIDFRELPEILGCLVLSVCQKAAMFIFTSKVILFLIIVLSICLDVIISSPLRSYQDVLEQEDRKVMILARILRIAMSLPDEGLFLGKRNAGTVDTLFNIPDLFEEGRR